MTPLGAGPETTHPASAHTPAVAGSRRPSLLVLLGIAVVLALLVRAFVVETFYVPSASMEPTLSPGDRLLVNKLDHDLRRGDVIVFDGTTTFGPSARDRAESSGPIGRALSAVAGALGISPGEADYVKRIVGLPGDRVTCCAADGRIEVNGTPVTEDELAPGVRPSDQAFDVAVPPGKLFVLGDNRLESSDSRDHLGDPGGGMLPESDVIGTVLFRYWPLGRAGTVRGSAGLASIPERGGP